MKILVPDPAPVINSTYLSYINTDLTTYGSGISTEVNSGDVGTYAGTCYYITGLTSIVEATGDPTVMTTLVNYVSTMVSKAQSFTKNSITYPEWYPLNGANPDQGNSFKAAAPIARLAALINKIPVFRVQYAAQLVTFTNFIKQSVFDLWFDKQTGIYANPSGVYLGGSVPWCSSDLDNGGYSYPVWTSFVGHLGIMSCYMYQATGNPLYFEYATRIGTEFKRHINIQTGGAYLWDSGIETTGGGGQDPDSLTGYADTSHSNREAWFVIVMYETGIPGYTLSDVMAMSYNFIDAIWNQDLANPMFSNYINGSNLMYRTANPWENGIIYAGWSMLSKYNPAVKTIIDKSINLIRAGGGLNASLGVGNNNSYGRIALAGNVANTVADKQNNLITRYLANIKADLVTYASAISTEINSGDAVNNYYSSSYYIHGLAVAAEATGDLAIMDTVVGYCTTAISKAIPAVWNGITYQEWGPLNTTSPYYPDQLSTFQMSSAVARVAAVIHGNPTFQARYATQFTTIVNFIDQAIFEYWYNKTTGVYAHSSNAFSYGYIPWLPSGVLDGWGSYPYWNDKCSHSGTIATFMYQATGLAKYREFAQRVASALRLHTTVQPDGSWILDVGIVQHDTSHANREPMMVVAMYENGIEFTLADVLAFAKTFTNLIWNQDETNPMFNNYADGTNQPFWGGSSILGPWACGNIYLGWDTLGKYSPKVQRICEIANELIRIGGTLNTSLTLQNNMYGKIELGGILMRNAQTILPSSIPTITVSLGTLAITTYTLLTTSVTAVVTGGVQTVTWTVDGVTNGNSTVGTITGSGNTRTYTAPMLSGIHILRATSTADVTKYAECTIKVQTTGFTYLGQFPSAALFVG